jgi:hypothetical protein
MGNMSRPSPGSSLPVWKKAVYGLISTVFVLVCLSVVAEVGLRVAVLLVPSFRSAPFRQYDPVLGESLIPNVSVIHSRGCFRGLVVTNQWGARDRERTIEKKPGEFRIALVGDSVVEAAQVLPDQVMNIQMEKMLAASGRTNVEVMAFGIAGIGTTQELLMYEEKVRQFHPDVVVLVFVDNDPMNNSSTIQPRVYGIHTWYCPYYNLGPNGELVFQPVQTRWFNGPRAFLERHSLVTYYLEHIWERVNIGNGTWEGIPLEWGVYGNPPDEEWSESWQVTEKVMKKLQDAVEADGSKFIVIKTPGFADIATDWHERLTKALGPIPPNFDAFSMQKHLQDIADRQHIALEFLAPDMQAYRDAHHLKFPYFSWTCETHYAPLGHEVVAKAIIKKLDEHHLLPTPDSAPSSEPSAEPAATQ